MKRFVVVNEQGEFSMPAGRGFIPGCGKEDVYMDERGVIHWLMRFPSGVLSYHPCGTKVFTNKDAGFQYDFYHTSRKVLREVFLNTIIKV